MKYQNFIFPIYFLFIFPFQNQAQAEDRAPETTGRFNQVQVSGDGKRIVFTSTFDLLKKGEKLKKTVQCYAYDLNTQTLSILSLDQNDKPLSPYCGYTQISKNGKFASFAISNGKSRQYYRVNLDTEERVLIYEDERASNTSGDLQGAKLSPDGSHALICSQSASVPGTQFSNPYPNGQTYSGLQVQIIEQDIENKQYRLISALPHTQAPFARGACWGDYSDDGNQISFEGNLSADQAQQMNWGTKKLSGHVFVKNIRKDTLTLVTSLPNGQPFQDWIVLAKSRISGDGRYVIFASSESSITRAYQPKDFTWMPSQILRKDLQTGSIEILSLGPKQVPVTSQIDDDSITLAKNNPGVIMFTSREDKLLPDDYFPGTLLNQSTSPSRLYLHDLLRDQWTVGEFLGNPNSVRIIEAHDDSITQNGNQVFFTATRINNPHCTESTPYEQCFEESMVYNEEHNTTRYYTGVKTYQSNDIFLRNLSDHSLTCLSCAWGQ